MSDELVTIGTFSMLTGLSVTTLRHYDEVALLAPAAIDRQTGYRRYSRDQVERARNIRSLRLIDLPLEEIRRALDGDLADFRGLLEAHRLRLQEQGDALKQMVATLNSYLEKGINVQAVQGVRLVAINLGVSSEDELANATTFWQSFFEAEFEDWGQGSQQMRIGSDETFGLVNIRVRSSDEPQFGHNAAFGLLVADVDKFHKRALDAGAIEHVAPQDAENRPRHSRFADPVGNRVVLWQG